MKKEMRKRFVAFLCVAALVFCNVGTVWAEENTNPPADIEQDEVVTPEVPEHTHTYAESVTKEPTTTVKGEKTFTCECGDSYTEEIPTVKLSAPGTFNVKNYGYTQLQLTWSKVSDAEGYEIHRADSKAGTYEKVATVGSSAVKYIDKNLTTNKTYYYKICAFYGEQPGEFTAVKSAVPKVLAATMKNTADATGTSIKVSWTKPAGATGYYVYRKTGTGNWSKIATIKTAATTSYTDKKATAKYSYSVIAYKTVNGKTYTSNRSNIIQASVLKKTASFTVTQKGTKPAVTVKWSKVSNATGYQVYRKNGSNGAWKLVKTTGSTATSYSQDMDLGTTVYFKVRAIRKIDGTTIYAPYSASKSFCFSLPDFEYEFSTGYGSSVKSLKLTIKNRGKQALRVYSENCMLMDEYNEANARDLYLVNSNGKKINYSDINAGKKKTMTIKVDGKGTRYRSDSIVCFVFRYDGLKYALISYVGGSYQELYLADDLFQ